MVNKEALRSPPDAVPFEQMADNSGGDNSSGDTFNDRTHATDAGAAFNTTRIMTVPDRIVLAGSEQHYELPGRPRELELDDQIYNNWSPSRIPISIQTPPRRLTLHDHSYPTADSEDYEDDATLQRQTSSGRQQQFNGSVANQLVGTTGDADDSEQQFLFYQGGTPSATPKGLRERPQFRASAQQTPQASKPLSTKNLTEKRFIDVYRRLETMEKDNRQRRYREIIIYVGFVGYFVYRSFSYMFGRSRPY